MIDPRRIAWGLRVDEHRLAESRGTYSQFVALDFAEDLGGSPEDYDAERYFEQMDGRAATDGGE